MLEFIVWYLSGLVACMILFRAFSGEILVKDFLSCLILAFTGLLAVASLLFVIFSFLIMQLCVFIHDWVGPEFWNRNLFSFWKKEEK